MINEEMDDQQVVKSLRKQVQFIFGALVLVSVLFGWNLYDKWVMEARYESRFEMLELNIIDAKHKAVVARMFATGTLEVTPEVARYDVEQKTLMHR